jgi:hypothetical protein
MPEDLRVTTAHVHELSARQGEAQAQIESASTVTDGLSIAMWINHGLICAPANAAVWTAEAARKSACAAMQSVSSDLSEKLDAAAQRYDEIDSANRDILDQQIPPR